MYSRIFVWMTWFCRTKRNRNCSNGGRGVVVISRYDLYNVGSFLNSFLCCVLAFYIFTTLCERVASASVRVFFFAFCLHFFSLFYLHIFLSYFLTHFFPILYWLRFFPLFLLVLFYVFVKNMINVFL